MTVSTIIYIFGLKSNFFSWFDKYALSANIIENQYFHAMKDSEIPTPTGDHSFIDYCGCQSAQQRNDETILRIFVSYSLVRTNFLEG